MSFSPFPSLEKDDWAGELGPFEPMLAILASVDVLSRPDGQLVENTDGPNGPLDCGGKFEARCGTDPARRRDSNAALLAAELFSLISPRPGEGALYGLGDGVGRELLGTIDGRLPSIPFGPPGENRDGTVPARARRPWGALSGVGSCI